MRLSVTTPRGTVVETDVDEVTAPGVLGEMGVLPGHVPLLSALKPGVLTFRARGHATVFAVGQGFVEVAPPGPAGDRVIVLTDTAVGAGEIDRAAAEREAAEADRDIAHWKRPLDGEYEALLLRRAWAQARVDAAARSAAH